MKKVLAINYSQTGQLDEILDNFFKSFTNVEVDRVKVAEVDKFPFPWTADRFFDVMPESVLEEPIDLEPFGLQYESYDLIVLGYQPWFLSPSIPTTSILKHPKFQEAIKGKPVVTVIGARNMWINSQESIKHYIQQSEGRLVANIPLYDTSNNLVSAMSILHWMLKGEKTRKWGILPKPGVGDQDIEGASDFGEIVSKSLEKEVYENLQSEILKLNRIDIPTNILFIEQRAKKLFMIWAKIILKKGTNPSKRKTWLKVFKYYLIFALFCVSPVVLLIFNIFVRPFTQRSILKKKKFILGLID